jgi:hypothetical protein
MDVHSKANFAKGKFPHTNPPSTSFIAKSIKIFAENARFQATGPIEMPKMWKICVRRREDGRWWMLVFGFVGYFIHFWPIFQMIGTNFVSNAVSIVIGDRKKLLIGLIGKNL